MAMRLHSFGWAAATALALGATLRLEPTTAAAALADVTRPDEWPAYARDLASTKYSPLALIDKDTFRNLRVAWRWSSPDNDIVKKDPSLHLNLFEGTPVMVDGAL